MTTIAEYVNADLESRSKRGFSGGLSSPFHFGFLCAAVGRNRSDLLREIAEAVEQGELEVESIQFRAAK